MGDRPQASARRLRYALRRAHRYRMWAARGCGALRQPGYENQNGFQLSLEWRWGFEAPCDTHALSAWVPAFAGMTMM